MRLLGKRVLVKLKQKNRGNKLLIEAIEKLIEDIEENDWTSPDELKIYRRDADCVHSSGFYFFNMAVLRTMILLEFEENEATVVWAGTHEDYSRTFKKNKDTIRNWLRSNDWI